MYLYGAETWYGIDDVSDELLLLERKFLKSILCVKGNIPDNLLYLELDRADIVVMTEQRQKSFFDKLLSFSESDAVARRIVALNRRHPGVFVLSRS